MDITLGLDFGTHQSKLCLSYMPNNEQIFEFLKFVQPDGDKTFLLPSIVQINKDDTISIGFVDKGNCKTCPTPAPQEPIFPEEPSSELHPRPKKTSYPEKPKEEKLDWKEQLSALSKGKSKNQELLKWEKRCREIDKKWEADYYKWLDTCEKIEEDHKNWQTLVDDMQRDYESKVASWKSHKDQLQYYRYFKLASFSDFPWDSENILDSDTLSIWYLTYLMLIVKQRVSEMFNESFKESVSIQMGVPSSLNTNLSKQIEHKACKLLIAARELMEYFSSPEELCTYKYQELLEITQIPSTNIKEAAEEYGLVVIPEAYAGLKSLTHRKRLRHGDMHLLVDIGGGTTDIAFFTVNDTLEPNIHRVKSFHRGLNYVFENFCREHPEYSISDAQELFKSSQELFKKGIEAYTKELNSLLSQMIEQIIHKFMEKAGQKGYHRSALTDAMEGRPIVYCGGGSMYQGMRICNQYFSDMKIVDKNMLSIPNLRNANVDERLFTILATSYGLSIAMLGEIEMMDADALFRQFAAAGPGPEKKNGKWIPDHEYGITDL